MRHACGNHRPDSSRPHLRYQVFQVEIVLHQNILPQDKIKRFPPQRLEPILKSKTSPHSISITKT